ncbi:MAG: hypothetical protein ACXAEF_10680, partial [Candidatus Thorarchaeota archaeon]
RTISLFGREISGYLLIALIPILINIGIQVVVLYLVFPGSILALLGSFGTDPFTILLTLFSSTADPLYLMVAIPLMFVGIVVSAIVAGAVIKLALDDYGTPGRGDWRESMSFALGRIVTIIVVQLLVAFVMIVCMMPGIVLTFMALATLDLMMMLYGLILMYLGIPIALYLTTRLAPAPAVVIAEDHGAIDSLKRAYSLSSGQFWHIFAGTLLLGVVVLIIGGVIGFATAPILLMGLTDPVTALLLLSAMTIISSIVTTPISQIFFAVLYRDLMARGDMVRDVW